MATGLQKVLERLRQTATRPTDGRLLRRYVAAWDEGSFAALMRRHGPILDTRAATARRRGTERQVRDMPHPEVAPTPLEDCGPLLDRFVFAQGTDPEFLLVLEAHVSRGMPQWHYALARQTMWILEVDYAGRRIWAVEKRTRATSHPQQTYFDIARQRDD